MEYETNKKRGEFVNKIKMQHAFELLIILEILKNI